MLHNETLDLIPLNNYKKVCHSCPVYLVLFAVFFITSICISSVFIYLQWYLKKNNVRIKFNPDTRKNKLLNAIPLSAAPLNI